jgi:glutamate-1-semialdehyde 2,1-aminomutase
MFGHSPKVVVDAVAQQLRNGITMMLPTPDSIGVGEELQKRFGLPYWQIAMSATDANRNSIRIARFITKRPYILVINGCYHGTVDETLVNIRDGQVKPRVSTPEIPRIFFSYYFQKGNVGAPVDPKLTTRIVEFNDIPALEKVPPKLLFSQTPPKIFPCPPKYFPSPPKVFIF